MKGLTDGDCSSYDARKNTFTKLTYPLPNWRTILMWKLKIEGKLSFKAHDVTDLHILLLYMRHSVTSFTRAAPHAPCHFTVRAEQSFFVLLLGLKILNGDRFFFGRSQPNLEWSGVKFVLCIFVYIFFFYCDLCSLCILLFAAIWHIK